MDEGWGNPNSIELERGFHAVEGIVVLEEYLGE